MAVIFSINYGLLRFSGSTGYHQKIHISYLAAGADIIQSSGYQATVAGFKGLGYGTEEAIELVKLSVHLASSSQ